MDDAAWGTLQQKFNATGMKHVATMIRRCAFETGLEYGTEHPVAQIVEATQCSTLPAFLCETDDALKWIEMWFKTREAQRHLGWWNNKLGLLGLDPENAAGVLAEVRALGAMLSNLHELTHVPVHPNSGPGKSADFCLDGEIPVFVEVCCLRMNHDELKRQIKLDEVEAILLEKGREAAVKALPETPGANVSVMARASWEQNSATGEGHSVQRHESNSVAIRTDDGQPYVFSMSLRDTRPQGPDKGGDVHTIASRIAGKKSSGQIPIDSPGILWMDCCDPSWAMSIHNTQPAEIFWKGMNLATTRGVWHSFYGQKDRTLMMERAALGFDFGDHHRQSCFQRFQGRFRSEPGRCWSAAVLRCTDGLVVFENPNPTVQLPFFALRGLTALKGYSPAMSFHRLSEDGAEELRVILKNAEGRLRFYACGSA